MAVPLVLEQTYMPSYEYMEVVSKTMTAFEMILVIVSLVSIVSICIKRCECFSIWTPLLFLVPNLFRSCTYWSSPIYEISDLVFWVMFNSFRNSAQRLNFSLEYLRSAFTVPLYFDQREKLDGNCTESAAKIAKRASKLRCFIYVTQVLVTIILGFSMASVFIFVEYSAMGLYFYSIATLFGLANIAVTMIASKRINKCK